MDYSECLISRHGNGAPRLASAGRRRGRYAGVTDEAYHCISVPLHKRAIFGRSVPCIEYIGSRVVSPRLPVRTGSVRPGSIRPDFKLALDVVMNMC